MENKTMKDIKDLLKAMALSLAVLVVLGLVTRYAFAEASVGKNIVAFAAYDINEDDYVSKSEFYHVNVQRMAKNDRTVMPLMHDPRASDFSEYDTDLDGQLSEMEFLHSCKGCHADR